LVTTQSWHTAIYRALVLLVVSCPCALVISTPVSIVAALAGAARKGVLIKGGARLERTSRVRCVAFDKTGTLTRGVPEVVEIIPLGSADEESVITLAASVERRSAHPIARAILRRAEDGRSQPEAAVGVSSAGGLGAEGRVGDAHVVVGNHRLFDERQLCSPAIHDRIEGLTDREQTVVLVERNEETIGIVAMADRP